MLKYIIFTIFVFQVSFSNIISEEGRGKTVELAKKDAIQNLSKRLEIEIDVKEEMVVFQDDKKERTSYKNEVSLKSSITLTGVKYKEQEKKEKEYIYIAYIDEEGLKEHRRGTQIKKEKLLNKLSQLSKDGSLESKRLILKDILVDIDIFEKMNSVIKLLDKKSKWIELGSVEVQLNGDRKVIVVNKSSLEDLNLKLKILLSKNSVGLSIIGDDLKLNSLLREYIVYLNSFNKQRYVISEREEATRILEIEVLKKDDLYSFNYYIKNLKTGARTLYLEKGQSYLELETGFVTDILKNTELINKKIGELLNEK
ncbi:MAG: hypothetical protein ACRC34_03825 [Cetobacterium sp.]